MTAVEQSPAIPAVSAPPGTLWRAAGSLEELAAALDRPASGTPVDGPRIGIVDPTPQRLALACKIIAKGKPQRGRRDIWFSPRPLLAAGGGLAFIYPGLEAEFAPRLDDIAPLLGLAAPEISTDSVGRHAASVFGVGRVLDAALRAIGLRPDALAGHSVGEWQAMIAGGMVDRTEFDAMVAAADLDGLRVPGVDFAVLGCSAARAAEEIAGHDGVTISHENSPQQTVVCGPSGGVHALVERLRGAGVICQVLPFRSGFHTPHLAPYLGVFRQQGLPSLPMRAASLPVWSTTTARPFPSDEPDIRELCVRHLLEPVRFGPMVRALYDDAGIRVFVQAGTGQLGSLIDDTLRSDDHLTVVANSPHRSGLEQLVRVATAVWVEGGRPDLALLGPGPARARSDARPPTEPERAQHTSLDRLRELSARHPALAELDALLDETAASVAAVLAAAESGPEPRVLDVSTSAMPYLLDHCMAAQRPGWPDETDRRPVMPATTMIAHLMQAAEASAPGRVVTEVRDVQFRKWLIAAPATRVEIDLQPLDRDSVQARLGEHCSAVIVLGSSYPARRPDVWPPAPDERPTAITAQQMYAERWMFHGPAFQGMTRADGISPTSIRGQITVTSPPGALLDNLGQLIGQWLTERQPDRCVAFPARIDRITFHTAEPPPGTTVDSAVRVTRLSPEEIVVDGQIVLDGRAAISVEGWHDYRVEGDQRVCAVHRKPDRCTLAERRNDGWWMLADPWTNLPSREFYMHKYLGAAERQEYRDCPPQLRRRWLLARIVVKDAARGWLSRAGFGHRYPAELLVTGGPANYQVSGQNGLRVPELTVAAALTHELAVARVQQPGSDGPDVVELAEVIEASLLVHKELSAQDEGLLDRARRGTCDPLPAALARLATVRAVAAKAGLPLPPVVSDVDGTTFTVRSSRGEPHRVSTELVRNPTGLPQRQYVLAWLLGS